MSRHLFVLLLFALAPSATAQVGQIGMPMWQLTAKLGTPHYVEHVDRAKPWLFQGQDEVWFYQGKAGEISFSYGITEGRVSSTHAMFLLHEREEASAWASRYAAALRKKGWHPEGAGADRHQLFSPARAFHIEIVPVREGYGVVLSQTLREDSSSVSPRPEDLLGFHTRQTTALSQAPAVPDTGVPAVPARLSESSAAPRTRHTGEPSTGQRTANVQHRPPPLQDTTRIASKLISPSPAPASPAPSAGARRNPRSYTWAVASLETFGQAEALAERYRAAGYPGHVFPGRHQNRLVYRVGIGTFRDLKELQASRSSLPADVPDDVWPLRIGG